MSEHLKATITDLQSKLAEQEKAVTKTKSLINQLAEMAGMQPLYAVEVEQGRMHLGIRSDQFYGQPQATCVREILEMRRAANQGPATVNEIYSALVDGGFAFDTKNDDNAKRGLRISITKNTIFHKLPNGKIGLLAWYPNAKSSKKEAPAAGESDPAGDDDSADGDGGTTE